MEPVPPRFRCVVWGDYEAFRCLVFWRKLSLIAPSFVFCPQCRGFFCSFYCILFPGSFIVALICIRRVLHFIYQVTGVVCLCVLALVVFAMLVIIVHFYGRSPTGLGVLAFSSVGFPPVLDRGP